MSIELIRIPPYHYIHVQDRNSNVTRLECGPQTFIRKDHELITTGNSPMKYIVMQPYFYTFINDPVVRDKDGALIYDTHGQVKVNIGGSQVRTSFEVKEPFPLYPGEQMGQSGALPVVPRNHAIKLQCSQDYTDAEGNQRIAGDEWLEFGPKIYVPQVEVDIIEIVKPSVISTNTALKVKAIRACKDSTGIQRQAGEEWLIRTPGFYITAINEELQEVISGTIITEVTALLLKATQTFTDVYGKERKAGEQWLITNDISSTHIVDVYEENLCDIDITILQEDEFCYILNPIDANGVNQLGKKVLVTGPKSFFVQPGEEISGGIQKTFILSPDEALLLMAEENYEDEDGEKRQAGDRWMVYGPKRYVLPVEVILIETRNSIPLDKNEGIYVRNTRTGTIESKQGETYMLKAHEELWAMELDDQVEQLLGIKGKRDKTRLVTFKCPFNSAVQVYDYKSKKSRVTFGPNLVSLEPDEQFTVVHLSGGKPKRPGVIKTLAVSLGPDFFSDIFHVETSDHAKLELQLSYNWFFQVDRADETTLQKIFNVRDFVGDACSAIASKVRGEVAGLEFEKFHKESARMIRKAIFDLDADKKVKENFMFTNNNLVVTNVDIQRVEPVDSSTKESLQKSVTLAIETTTQMQESAAKKEANQKEQEAKGSLQKRQIEAESLAEKDRKQLYNLQAECESIKSQGTATAEAKAKAQQLEIEGQSEVELSQLKANAKKILENAEISFLKSKHEMELKKAKAFKELEIKKAKELAEIESGKFKKIVDAIGQDTLVALSKAGPELQAELLQSLGLQGYLMMDSNNPINLFSAVNGMVGK